VSLEDEYKTKQRIRVESHLTILWHNDLMAKAPESPQALRGLAADQATPTADAGKGIRGPLPNRLWKSYPSSANPVEGTKQGPGELSPTLRGLAPGSWRLRSRPGGGDARADGYKWKERQSLSGRGLTAEDLDARMRDRPEGHRDSDHSRDLPIS
jgi:hypothetical protein